MDLIGIIAAMLLNASLGCSAMKAELQRVGSQDYLISSWTCEDKHGTLHLWRTWQRSCTAPNQTQYYGRPMFLEETGSQLGIYHNQFGELQGGYGATTSEAYLPPCGS